MLVCSFNTNLDVLELDRNALIQIRRDLCERMALLSLLSFKAFHGAYCKYNLRGLRSLLDDGNQIFAQAYGLTPMACVVSLVSFVISLP
jgi:hypothetical protein